MNKSSRQRVRGGGTMRSRSSGSSSSSSSSHHQPAIWFCDKAVDDNDYLKRPQLRRAGSSINDFASMSSLYGECSCESEEYADDGVITSVRSTLGVLRRGVTADFCKNGLPWQGVECRSAMAGLSGIMYLLPAAAAPTKSYDQVMWIVQAFLSVMADYFHIPHDSLWHGVDRYFAVYNMITILYRASQGLHAYILLFSFIPIGCYMAANRSKNRRDLASWHFCHFLWHLSGGLIGCLVIVLLHACPNAESLLDALCQVES